MTNPGYYWLMLDTLHIAGPFHTQDEAYKYLEDDTDGNGLITVYSGEEVCLVPAVDITVEFAPLATLQEILEQEKINEG
tara:strand:+ start:1151 stop:1387 length:237 start_codon:yes stop_codon:yes gene_type:complete